MPAPRVVYLRSLEELRAAAAAWDDLWRRSETTFPTLQAEHIAQWIEHFAPQTKCMAVAVEENGRFTAALPLLGRKIARVFRGGAFPCNEWSSSGDLLRDAGSEAGRTLDPLLAAVADLPISLLWLDEILPDTNRWKAFLQTLERRESKTVVRPRWQAGRVEIGGDWQAYRSTWSRKHRQNTAHCIRQLSHSGDLQLRLLSAFAPGEAARWMRRGWEIENLGWKGAAGSSVLKTPGMEAFYAKQAELLARENQLELAFLESAGRPIAFAYGQSAKGVFHSVKIGYDPSFADYSPGQLLRYFLLERFHGERDRKALDFLGPLTDSHAAWQPKTYAVSRLAASLGGLAGNLAVAAYRRWRSSV
ncbi:MAG: GNAT family N-acetyltransferase [Pirellulales bacterium]|nr:GNAT family N-acetyltransferase [Pirellulales bacterium]